MNEAEWRQHCDEPSCDLGTFRFTCPHCDRPVVDYETWFDFSLVVIKGQVVEIGCEECHVALLVFRDGDFSTQVALVQPERLMDMSVVKKQELTEFDLTCEMWREYDFQGRIYRIEKPAKLFTRVGGTTHRVIDGNGVAHCVPAPGQLGCVLRWQNSDPANPANF